MSIYNIIIWSFNEWGVKFEMLNHGGIPKFLSEQREFTGKYSFRVQIAGMSFYIVPNTDTLKIDIRGYQTGEIGSLEEHTLNLYDPDSLPMLHAIVTTRPPPLRTAPRAVPVPVPATPDTATAPGTIPGTTPRREEP